MTACLLTPDARSVNGQPIGRPLLDALRQRVFEKGLCASDFEALLDYNAAAFQHVFGENVLLKVEFDVALIGEHSHLVHIPAGHRDPEIITAYPEDGKLRVEGPRAWHSSVHSPLRGGQTYQRIAIIAEDFGPAKWRKVELLATAIDEARLNYNFLLQNSNSVVATLAEAAGEIFTDLPGGGLNFGAGNLLFDELDGGNQVPELLIRGGTSYSGPIESDAPGSLPEEVDTDG